MAVFGHPNRDPIDVDFGGFGRDEVEVGSVAGRPGLANEIDLRTVGHDGLEGKARPTLEQFMADIVRNDRSVIGVHLHAVETKIRTGHGKMFGLTHQGFSHDERMLDEKSLEGILCAVDLERREIDCTAVSGFAFEVVRVDVGVD